MIQLIVNAFVEKDKTGAVVEVLYASNNHEKVKDKYEELVAQHPENYLVIYDLALDTNLYILSCCLLCLLEKRSLGYLDSLFPKG